MIAYHQAFDLYHTVYRMVQILDHFDGNDSVEVDRLRIWDFYLLFPNEIHKIKLKKDEKDIKNILQNYVKPKYNPYENIIDDRKIFERILFYQVSALKCLASYGIIDKDALNYNRVAVVSKDLLKKYIGIFGELPPREKNIIAILTSHFYHMSMFGPNGLKSRTNLMISKYDAK